MFNYTAKESKSIKMLFPEMKETDIIVVQGDVAMLYDASEATPEDIIKDIVRGQGGGLNWQFAEGFSIGNVHIMGIKL